MDGTHSGPKRFWLHQIIKKHEAELVYDLRKLGINPAKVDLDELILLVEMLIRDPQSWLHTAVADWKHPISYEWTVLAATYDLLAQVNSKRKPKPWQRPWKDPSTKQLGRNLRKDARAVLARAKDGEIEWQSKPTRM